MPKIEFSLLDRIRLAYWFVFKKEKYGLYEECGMCKSSRMTRTESSETGEVYEAKYKCLDCGAVASVRELWSMDK